MPEPPYPGWRPYCLVCDTMQRMEAREYGWQCVACKNKINHDLTHHVDPMLQSSLDFAKRWVRSGTITKVQ